LQKLCTKILMYSKKCGLKASQFTGFQMQEGLN
jgi:hypothetical protein